mgnify:CR=1 FL=1
MESKSTSRTLQTQKSCFSIFPDVPWCFFHLRHLLHVSAFPLSSFILPTHLPFPPFYHSKLLPYFHLTPRTFKQSPVNHSRNNVVRFVSFSRVSTVRPSGKVPNRHRRSRDTRACCISSVPVLSRPSFERNPRRRPDTN